MNKGAGRTLRALILLGLAVAPGLQAFVSQRSIWPEGEVKVFLRLGGSATPLTDEFDSFDAVGEWSVEKWNLFMARSKLVAERRAPEENLIGNGLNDIYFANEVAGRSIGSALAITYGFRPVGTYREESDILVNTDYEWDSYRGDLVFGKEDLRRVLFHEFGHLLGLDHPDEEGQDVEAIMNSTVSDAEGLLEDDVRGMVYLYGNLGEEGGVGATDDHGGLFATATWVTGNSVIQGVLQDWDRDIFRVDIEGTGAVQVETTGAMDTFGYLHAVDGFYLAFNDDSGADTNTKFIAPRAGGFPLFFSIEAFDGETVGDYELEVTLLPDPEAGDTISDEFKGAKVIGAGETIEGRLDHSFDTDAYRIELVETGRLSIAVSGDTITSAILFDGDQEIVELDGGLFPTSSPAIQSEVLPAGTYYFAVLSLVSYDIGDYAFTTEFTPYDPDAVAPAKLVNLSVRTGASGAFGPLIMGFVTAGADKELLVRAAGRSLADFGITDHVNDATLSWLGSDGVEIAGNDDWWLSDDYDRIVALGADLGAFEFTSLLDSALIADPAPGAYTAAVEDYDDEPGQVLVEVYDADSLDAPGRLVNLSTRSQVGLNNTFLTAGFVVSGEGTIRLLIRGIGPELANYGVTGVLADPGLELFNVDGEVIASNDDWGAAEGDLVTLFTDLGAFPLTPDSTDASLVIELNPGVYTVQLKGKPEQVGQGLIEIYEIPAE